MRREHNPVSYYDDHAEEFLLATQDADMGVVLACFLEELSDGLRVLDWGCGSGRVSLALLAAGCDVTAVDLSSAMCAATAALTALEPRNESFFDLDDVDRYDGIWASASLLHVPSVDLPAVLHRAATALKPRGALYCSFKYGTGELERNGRFFNDMTEEKFTSLLGSVPSLRLVETWVTEDVRPERAGELWLNCLLRRV